MLIFNTINFFIGFTAMYLAFEAEMNVGRLIGAMISLKFAFLVVTTSLPSMAAFLCIIQCIDVTRVMIRNYHSLILPQSKNGRLIRGSKKRNSSPPPPYGSVGSLQHGEQSCQYTIILQGLWVKGSGLYVGQLLFKQGFFISLDSRGNSRSKSNKADIFVNSLATVNDVDTMLDYGNDLADITEHLDNAFGTLLVLDVFTSVGIGSCNLYIVCSSILAIQTVDGGSKVTMMALFGIYFFILGYIYTYRLKVVINSCTKLERELEQSWTALREVSILKFTKMVPQQIYELSALRDKINHIMGNAINPNGYFHLGKGLVVTLVATIIGYFLILLGFRSEELMNWHKLNNSTISVA
jgi:hypothetical protein